jgi:hypothetical protein
MDTLVCNKDEEIMQYQIWGCFDNTTIRHTTHTPSEPTTCKKEREKINLLGCTYK